MINNKPYDIIKDVSLLWMPIAITFYGVISATWGFPYGEQILATLTGLNAALGAITKYYKSKYDKFDFDEVESLESVYTDNRKGDEDEEA